MKRDKNLQALSRDHHHGLLLGWKIRQGMKFNTQPELIAEYVHYFSEAALFPHFQQEEEQILIYMDDSNSFKKRTIQDHRDIASLIASLESAGNLPDALLQVAQRLDDHIRFEERELFPYLQEELSPSQLDEIGLAIDAIHQPFSESFHNEFWVAQKN